MNQFWAQRSASEKRMLVICAVVLVVGLPLMLIPSGGSSKKLLSPQEARLKYRQTLAEKTDLDQRTDQLDPAISKMAYADPPEKLMPVVVRTLQGYANQSGIHIREIKPLRAKKYPNLVKETLSVRFTSEFGKAIPFLYRIEDPAGKLVVDRFNVTAADPKSRMVDVEAQVSLFTKSTAGDESTTTGQAVRTSG